MVESFTRLLSPSRLVTASYLNMVVGSDRVERFFLTEMIIVAIVSLAACAILLKWNLVLKDKLEHKESEITGHELEKEEFVQKLETAELQRQFFGRLVDELSLLSEQLHNRVKIRNISHLLLQVMVRNFEPKQAMILLRRRPVASAPERSACLAVAEVHPPDSSVKKGTEIAIGQGELGFVAEAQLTMNRQDFDRSSLDPDEPRDKTFPGFRAQIAAPLVFDKDTLGVITIAGSPYKDAEAKKALRLIARIGAVAIKNAASYSQMKLTAEIDGLTRVYNKRWMIQALGERIHESEQELSSFSIFLFDIDNFKNYNDVNGHVAGDQLLKELAQLVQNNIRDEDLFGRFGGEEFLLILSDTTSTEALNVANKLRTLISQEGFPFAERQPLGIMSVSGGVATYPAIALDSTGLLKAADQALYVAKKQGRNRVLLAQEQYLSGGQGELAVTYHRHGTAADKDDDPESG